jgi:hypothetical protein
VTQVKSSKYSKVLAQNVSNFNQFRPFKQIQLAEADRQNMIQLFKEEGLTDEQIANLPMASRRVENPRGLNEIIFEVSGRKIEGDFWDKDVPKYTYIGRWKSGSAKRKSQEFWGKMMEQYAFEYLRNNLQDSGWLLKRGEEIDGREYDCLGWYRKNEQNQNPDLAIEMTFPIPKSSADYSFHFLTGRIRQYRRKLKLLNAKYKYILIGVSRNKVITFLEIRHSDMKLKLQGHRFENLKLEKRIHDK